MRSDSPDSPNPTPLQPDATGVHDSDVLFDTSLTEPIADLLGFKNVPGYEVESVLGSGACGVVFRAKQLKLDRTVALKTIVLDKTVTGNMLARFEKEAVALAKLQHPHIVNVFDSGKHEGRLFFAMELLEGRDLDEHISKFGELPELHAWSIARQTATALAHAAKAGIIHRDVKPANLFLVTPPTGYQLPQGVPMVKVTDFGLALCTDASKSGDTRLTHTGTVVGTPIYMAPEQFSNPDIDSRADIYALGATVHHMLTGVVPFNGKSIWEVMTKKSNPVPPPLGERISVESIRLVAAMLQPNPDLRVGSYLELISRIDALSNGLDPAQTQVFQRTPRVPRKLGFALLAGILVGVAIAITAALVLRNRTAPTAERAKAVRFVSEGKSLALFNGEDLKNWTSGGGKWSVEDDDAEGGKKIVGWGNLKTSLDRKPPFRIMVGLEVRDADTAVEVPICKSRGPADRAIVHSVKIQRRGVQLGRKTGDRGTWEPSGELVPYPTPERLGDSSAYQPLEIDAHGDRWIVRFRTSEVGVIPDDGTLALGEVAFAVIGGQVRIESVVLEGLKPAE